MPHNRMVFYVGLAGWVGALSATGWHNAFTGQWAVVAVNVILTAAVGTMLALMGRNDTRRGRIAAPSAGEDSTEAERGRG